MIFGFILCLTLIIVSFIIPVNSGFSELILILAMIIFPVMYFIDAVKSKIDTDKEAMKLFEEMENYLDEDVEIIND